MENITIKDIARICGVGVSTVSRAINDYPGINAETKKKILDTIAEYHYVPNNSARNLKMLESDTVALIIKGIDNLFFHGMIKMFEEEFKGSGYTFILQMVNENQDEAEIALELAKEKRLRGIIFLGGLVNSRYSEEALNSINIPYVRCTGLITNNRDKLKFSSVSIDDEKESYKVVDYLCKMGHKKIAIISERGKTLGAARQLGYERALRDNGIEVDQNLIVYMREDLPTYSIENGYAVIKELMDSEKEFTALYAISDLLAFGAYKAIKESGKSIPDDISVVGFDGLSMTDYFTPALTTVEQPQNGMVKASIQMLLDAIEGDCEKKEVIYETRIIEKDSIKRLKE